MPARWFGVVLSRTMWTAATAATIAKKLLCVEIDGYNILGAGWCWEEKKSSSSFYVARRAKIMKLIKEKLPLQRTADWSKKKVCHEVSMCINVNGGIIEQQRRKEQLDWGRKKSLQHLSYSTTAKLTAIPGKIEHEGKIFVLLLTFAERGSIWNDFLASTFELFCLFLRSLRQDSPF